MMSQPVPYLPKARNNVYKNKIYLLPQRHHLPQGIHIHPEITLMILLYFLCIVVVIAFFFKITSLINCTTVLIIIFELLLAGWPSEEICCILCIGLMAT